jgi:hypothetical protein
MRYTAWIAVAPDKLLGCVLADISDTGGRLDVDDSDAIPDRFTLWLARNGSAKRACRVVWRQTRQLGVAFDRVVAPTGRDSRPTRYAPGLVPAPALVPEQASDETAPAPLSEQADAEKA